MDTKLRNLNNRFVRGIVFILCIVCFTGTYFSGCMTFLKMATTPGGSGKDPMDLLLCENYEESAGLSQSFHETASGLVNDLFYGMAEGGDLRRLSNDQLEAEKRELFQKKMPQVGEGKYDDAASDYLGYTAPDSQGKKYVSSYNNQESREYFAKTYGSEIKVIEDRLKKEQEREYQMMLKNLSETKGLTFYISDGTRMLTNCNGLAPTSTGKDLESHFKSKPAYRIYQDGNYEIYPIPKNSGHAFSFESATKGIMESHYTQLAVYMAYDSDFIQEQSEFFDLAKEAFVAGGIATLIFGFLTIILFLYLLIAVGKKGEDGQVTLSGIDSWFTEFFLAGIIFCGFMGLFTLITSVDDMVRYNMDYYENLNRYTGLGTTPYVENTAIYNQQMIFYGLTLGILAAFGLLFLLTVVKKIKAKRFFKDAFIYRIFAWIKGIVADVFNGSSTMKKAIILVVGLCLSSTTVLLCPLAIILGIFFTIKTVKKYEAIKEGVAQVKTGDLTHKILIEGDGKDELSRLAKDINDISAGFDVAVQQEMKNQRLKTELISNVSHDIKTPLTSIITYVDLLKKEGIDCADKEKYLDIIDQKSVRLKKLTEDLFEAAKASSGDMPVHMEKVELLSLVNQGLGEMNDRLSKQGLQVITKAELEKYYVLADGQLLWRVLENLLGNAIKYALTDSRVYIDIRIESMNSGPKTKAVLEMKNVSRNALNIPVDELLERFKRGDESRSTDGSGLGLSIAKDLMQLQGGEFEIVVDGDLFKAILTIPSY